MAKWLLMTAVLMAGCSPTYFHDNQPDRDDRAKRAAVREVWVGMYGDECNIYVKFDDGTGLKVFNVSDRVCEKTAK